MSETKQTMAIPLDSDGFYRASLMYCGQCGYPHRTGPNGPDHGGKAVLVSYALADAEKEARLAAEDAGLTPEPIPLRVRLDNAGHVTRVSRPRLPSDGSAQETKPPPISSPRDETPENIVPEETKRAGRPRLYATDAERKAAHRARKAQGGQ